LQNQVANQLLASSPAFKHKNLPISPYQLLASANNVNLLGNNIQTLNDASKEVGLVVNAQKTKSMLLSCHQMQGKIMT
jgi:hypothetical protein